MFERYLSADFVQRLCSSTFWPNVVANLALQPEIRRDSLTVYCRGSGLIRELRLDGDRLTGWTHPSFIPVRVSAGGQLAVLDTSDGFVFSPTPVPLPLGTLSPETVEAYLACLPQRPEDVLKDAIIRHPNNTILDQEVAFADTRADRDRVDLCAYLAEQSAIALVEIKRVEDARLKSRNGVVEVIDQLAAYGTRVTNHHDEILAAYQEVTRLKRCLGLEKRIHAVPEGGPFALLPKPVLVIGGCSGLEVSQIRQGCDDWGPLLQKLPGVAAGLILCGDGCKLVLGGFPHTLRFA